MTAHLDGEIRDGRHHMQIRVYYEDTDFSGIVYHANYLRFMERGRTNHLRLMGAEQHALFAEVETETPGFAFVVRSMKPNRGCAPCRARYGRASEWGSPCMAARLVGLLPRKRRCGKSRADGLTAWANLW